MSQGNRVQAKYQSDAGDVFEGSVNTPTLAFTAGGVANANAAGAISAPVGIRFTQSNTAIGVKARRVGFKFTGDVPAGYAENRIHYLPIMTPTSYAAYTLGATGTYLGEAIEIVSRVGEISR